MAAAAEPGAEAISNDVLPREIGMAARNGVDAQTERLSVCQGAIQWCEKRVDTLLNEIGVQTLHQHLVAVV